ncbi:MAG TPA: signal peptidase II, partial [Longimicrobiales bacterium]|nr:signal peptidase II [Longimicrobiales bacterium]
MSEWSGAAEADADTRPATLASQKGALFFGVVSSVVALDYFTKVLVQRLLTPYQQVELVGEYVRLTYIYNPGAAFGIHLGPYSRIIFLLLSVAALLALAGMYWVTPARDSGRLGAIALICGGAIGNLIDRVRSEQGVIDFLDVGLGDLRWPVFNIADIAVTTGAIFLALSLWQED